MARLRVGGPKEFWNRLKSISVKEIQQEANRPVSVAVIGDIEKRDRIVEMLTAALPNAGMLCAAPSVSAFDSNSVDAGFPSEPGMFDFVIDAGGGRVVETMGEIIFPLADLGNEDALIERIFDDRNEITLALARSFPVFRKLAAAQVIQQTAITNAEFSLITGVASAFPLFEIILPANAISDILVLTKNQIMMVLRLAAVYGLEIDYKSRMKELGPILINAFGWRAVARELVGAVPAVGFVFRAMISYAGTVAIGRTTQIYFESAETVTRGQAQRLYKDAYAASRDRVRALAARVKSVPGARRKAKG